MKKMTMILDDADYKTIQNEIARYQRDSRNIAPQGPTIIPDGESDLAGSIIAECIRSLNEYRQMWESQQP